MSVYILNDCCWMPTHFSAISWREQINCQWDDDEISFELDQHFLKQIWPSSCGFWDKKGTNGSKRINGKTNKAWVGGVCKIGTFLWLNSDGQPAKHSYKTRLTPPECLSQASTWISTINCCDPPFLCSVKGDISVFSLPLTYLSHHK
jgi:hypothetical protein